MDPLATISLDEARLCSFKVAKVFHDNSSPITSLNFDASGEFLVTGSTGDESIVLYDALLAKPRKTIFSKKYGVSHVRFTHRPTAVIYASTHPADGIKASSSSSPEQNTIRYLSLHDNAYLRYFCGHTEPVTSIEMSPLDDGFLSAASDGVRLWDLRSPHVQGQLQLTGMANGPLLAVDPRGLVFAISLPGPSTNTIRFYDFKSYEKGPFAVFEVVDSFRPGLAWCGIKFTADGRDLVISTKEGITYLMDSFEGTIRQVYGNLSAQSALPLSMSKASASTPISGCTPDAVYVYTFSLPDQKLNFYARESGKLVASLDSTHPGTPTAVLFNPKYAMMASTCSNLVVSRPSYDWLTDTVL